MTSRSRKDQSRYDHDRKHIVSTNCVFCDIQKKHAQYIDETTHFKIVRNIYPYTHWDQQGVADHLMIIPKQHTATLADLSEDEALEYVKLISSYESNGYNVYARAPSSKIKSVDHQHTHLIKPDGKTIKFLMYTKTPHVRIVK